METNGQKLIPKKIAIIIIILSIITSTTIMGLLTAMMIHSRSDDEIETSEVIHSNDDELEEHYRNSIEGYPTFGEWLEDIAIANELDIQWGEYISSHNFPDEEEKLGVEIGSNYILDLHQTLFDLPVNTIYFFDDTDRLRSLITHFRSATYFEEEYDMIREHLIQLYGQPTFENIYVLDETKYDNSSQDNLQYIVRWDADNGLAHQYALLQRSLTSQGFYEVKLHYAIHDSTKQ